MIGLIKVFLVSWLSLIFFWLAAVIFCFWGSETSNKFWLRRILIGLPFFGVFCFLVFAFGVPRYFVYDHVPPQKMDGKLYYPAVKNHLILQGINYKTHGIITQDLSDFKAGDELFTAFKVKPLSVYPSATGLTRFTNELLLLGLFVIWWLLINKLHNASISSSLYREAKKSPSLASLNSYLNASSSLWLIQPIKRRKAKKEVLKIRLIYSSYLQVVLNKCIQNVDDSAKNVLSLLSTDLKKFTLVNPRINVLAKLVDNSTPEDIKKFEANLDYGREYFLPSEMELGQQLSKSFADTLNKFLPETFVESSNEADAIKLEGDFAYRAVGNATYQRGSIALQMAIGSTLRSPPQNNVIFCKNNQYLKLTEVLENKPQKSRLVSASIYAQYVVSDLILKTEEINQSAKIEKANYEAKLAEITKQKTDLFDTLIKECKSASTEAAVVAGIAVVMQKNPEMVDKVMVSVYEFLSANSDLIADIVAEEVAAGLIESIVSSADA